MDEFTRNFLDENGLGEYNTAFKDNKVTQASLPLLSQDMVASFIIPYGDRAIFNQAREKLISNAKKQQKSNVPSFKKSSEIDDKSEVIHETRKDAITSILPSKILDAERSSAEDTESESETRSPKFEDSENESVEDLDDDEGVESSGAKAESDGAQKQKNLLKKSETKSGALNPRSKNRTVSPCHDPSATYYESGSEERENSWKSDGKRKREDSENSDKHDRKRDKKDRPKKAAEYRKEDNPLSKKVLGSVENERFETKEDYRKFLLSLKDGQDILRYYEKHGTLNRSLRDDLTRLIISKLMAIKDGTLKNKDFEIAAKIFSQLFHGESVGTYYVPPIHGKKSQQVPSSGKLPYRYRNVKYGKKGKSIKQEISESEEEKEKTSTTEKFALLATDVYEKKKRFLDHYSEPWTEVCQLWTETSPNRLSLLSENVGNKVEEIFSEWPLFKHPSAPTLMNIDFSQLHKLKQAEFLVRWPTSKVHIAEYMSRNIVNSKAASLLKEAISKDHDDASILHLLPALLHSAVIRKKGKKTWKPTILESQEAFILCKSTKAEISESLAIRKEKLFKHGYTMQTCIAIQGQSVDDPRAAYFLIIDKYFYQVENIVKAVDVCFKCFHVMNIEYPVEVFDVWMFIQRFFFNIYTKHDNLSTQVTTLLNAL